jgi:hypothetical protein
MTANSLFTEPKILSTFQWDSFSDCESSIKGLSVDLVSRRLKDPRVYLEGGKWHGFNTSSLLLVS